MITRSLTDQAIEQELGARIKSMRLRRNMTQKSLSELTMLSLNSIKSLEAGKAKLSTLIAVLRELNSLDELNNFIPEVMISPLQLAKRKGKERLRASGAHTHKDTGKDEPW